jgi:hypothetical protein
VAKGKGGLVGKREVGGKRERMINEERGISGKNGD